MAVVPISSCLLNYMYSNTTPWYVQSDIRQFPGLTFDSFPLITENESAYFKRIQHEMGQ